MLKHFWGALGNFGLKKRKTYLNIRVHVRNFHKDVAHVYGDVKLLAALTDEGLGLGFARLYLAADKLP